MSKWVILVGGGYGGFFFDGTEDEAEERRRLKARWEGAPARKRPASDEEIESGEINHCKNHPLFGSKSRFACDCGNC